MICMKDCREISLLDSLVYKVSHIMYKISFKYIKIGPICINRAPTNGPKMTMNRQMWLFLKLFSEVLYISDIHFRVQHV